MQDLWIPRRSVLLQGDRYWIGAGIGVILLAFVATLWTSIQVYYGTERVWIVLGAVGVTMLSFVIFWVLSVLVVKSLRLYPFYFIGALGAAIGLLMVLKNTRFSMPNHFFYLGGSFALISSAFVGGALSAFLTGNWKVSRRFQQAIISICGIVGVGYLIYAATWLLSEGTNPYDNEFSQKLIPSDQLIDLPDPSAPGVYAFNKFTYGSGVNNQRPEYGAEADYTSRTVNGRYILPSWKKRQAEKRKEYWGFGIEEWPLNGTVWMPEGDGPFPIVLIVHGNHNMEDYSDPGYAYLGELLSSRGFIVVSVDENFINGSWVGDFRGKELPARAWLLLKHLEQWREWNIDKSHPLSGKADLEKIALVGHSRGGEAVPIAAAFNALPYFPDDAREQFDFNFGIRSVIAIAPTDYRYDRRVVLENVDYLGIQGSYDSDEDSFFGLRQLQRIGFSDSSFHLKSGVYIHGANHGQFNTGWGRHDAGFPYKMYLNTQPMISGEEQRKYAEVLISSFLEVSLNGKQKYAKVFRDLRQADRWLPENVINLTLYEDSETSYLADFEEDIDVTTVKNGNVTAVGFDLWAEDYLQFRAGRHQHNHALVLGWQNDSISEEANYTIALDSTFEFGSKDLITISVAAGDPGLLESINEDSLSNDFKIVLRDSEGNEASRKLSDYKLVVPRLKIRFLKTKKLTTDRYDNEWEPVSESVFIPTSDFEGLDMSAIESISFKMNTEKPGIILLDRIGVVGSL